AKSRNSLRADQLFHVIGPLAQQFEFLVAWIPVRIPRRHATICVVEDQATLPQAVPLSFEPGRDRVTAVVVVEILGCAWFDQRGLQTMVGKEAREHTLVPRTS